MMKESLRLLPRHADETHGAYAHRVLRLNIMMLNLAPGTPINEQEIAEVLEMSRTPVHETMLRLRDEQLVDIYPRSASRVSQISLRLAAEGVFLRLCIEPKMLAQIEGNLSPELVARFSEVLAEQKRCIEEDAERYRFYEVDGKFHQLIYQAASKGNLYEVLQRATSHFDRIRYLVTILGGYDVTSAYEEHTELLYFMMLGNKNLTDIDSFYSEHIYGFKPFLPQLTTEYPDYFVADEAWPQEFLD